MNLYSDYETLEEILTNLRTDDRKQASTEMKFHVEAAARELSLERFSSFENSLFMTIFNFVQSENMGDKLGGIVAIRELIDCTSASAEGKIIKFASTLAIALKNNTDFAIIELVADALGYMARFSSASQVDYVERELDRSLEWLSGTVTHRRHAACAVLHQLAENAPTIFFARSADFFHLIWFFSLDVHIFNL